MQALKYVFWRPQTPWSFSQIFFLSVNQNDPGMSLTTNHKFYKALGQLHGPWCKQPLWLCMIL